MTEPLDLAPIKARLEAVPTIDWDRSWRWVDKFLVGWGGSCILEAVDLVSLGDARLIANAPTDIAALLTEVERLEAELNKALTTHRQLLDQLETL